MGFFFAFSQGRFFVCVVFVLPTANVNIYMLMLEALTTQQRVTLGHYGLYFFLLLINE